MRNLSRLEPLVRALAHGGFVSGESLGELLGVSRSAVWKQLQSLNTLELELHRVRGRGYRLAHALELLDLHTISSALTVAHAAPIHCPFVVASTNQFLSELSGRGVNGETCLSEYQTAGRGRRGRTWVSPLGANIYLSMLWHFERGAEQLGGLSLAVGVILVRCLEGLGIKRVELKWPNDLYLSGKKLGGILIEVSGESGGPCKAVIGVGLNVRMPGAAAGAIDQPWAQLAELDSQISRNSLAAALISALAPGLACFAEQGLEPYHKAWQERDALYGHHIVLDLGGRELSGRAAGIDRHGQLLLDTADGRQALGFGEISVRKGAGDWS